MLNIIRLTKDSFNLLSKVFHNSRISLNANIHYFRYEWYNHEYAVESVFRTTILRRTSFIFH